MIRDEVLDVLAAALTLGGYRSFWELLSALQFRGEVPRDLPHGGLGLLVAAEAELGKRCTVLLDECGRPLGIVDVTGRPL